MVSEYLSGLDLSSLEFRIGDTLVFNTTNPCFLYDAATGRIDLDLVCAGITFSDLDTVNVCAYAHDTPDYCAPNEGVFCYSFIVSLTPPGPSVVTYLPTNWVACDSGFQHVIMTIIDPMA